MDPDRWQRIWQMCHEAVELDEGQQASFLRAACAARSSPAGLIELHGFVA